MVVTMPITRLFAALLQPCFIALKQPCNKVVISIWEVTINNALMWYFEHHSD